MKLYYAPGACSLAPHIVIREAGLDVQLEKVTFAADGRRADGRNYYEINPMGAVPALEIAPGEVLTENAVLLQYLASLAPAADLGPPAEGIAHWRFLELLNFITTELHKSFSPLFRGPSPEVREQVVALLRQRFGMLAKRLDDQPYLTGEQFKIVDAYAYVMMTWAKLHRLDLTEWPKLGSLKTRVEQRPAVQTARREEGLPETA